MMISAKNITKSAVGLLTAGAVVLTPVSPAFARHERDNRASPGEIIAGALIIGGIAAIVSAASKSDRRAGGYSRDYDRGYNRSEDHAEYYRESAHHNGNPRDAIAQCIATVEQDAMRMGRGYARVTQIRDIEAARRGWFITGDVVMNGSDSRGGYYDADYRRGRGHHRHHGARSRTEYGSFYCETDRGGVRGVRYQGLRDTY